MWWQKARKQTKIDRSISKGHWGQLEGALTGQRLGSLSMKMNNLLNHLKWIKSREFIILKIQQSKEKWARQNSLNIIVHFCDINSLFWKLTVENINILSCLSTMNCLQRNQIPDVAKILLWGLTMLIRF